MSDTEPVFTPEEIVVLSGDAPVQDEPAEAMPQEVNILPLRESVVFPMLIAPLSVSRTASVKLIDESVVGEQRIIGVIAQKDPNTDEPGPDDIEDVGCLVVIRTLMKSQDATRLIVQGLQRFRITEVLQEKPYLRAKVETIPETEVTPESAEEIEAMRRSVASLFEQAVRMAPGLPDELSGLTQNVNEPNVLVDLVAAHIPFSVQEKQTILSTVDLQDRMHKLLEILGREVRVLELTSKVQNEVTAELSRNQREYFLREQLKAIQRELGEGEETGDDVEELIEKIADADMPPDALKAAQRELDRLRRINPGSPEYTVARTYVETIASFPWNQKTDDNLDLVHAQSVLDEDHFGLVKIKERIIEFLAVRKVKTEGPVRQPIICFFGPPGVGKTSLGRSIARAMGREFTRLSLGGVRDEAEIRGHRRTYIGSLPGQIVQGLRRVGTNNPVFLLDEIDKLGNDFRGDPASALLEVLDPHQNATFRDHYLDVPVDLSNVLFLTTANRMDTIPPPLRDRMEIIELGGYTEEEKAEISRRHLIPRQLEEHGIPSRKANFKDDALRQLIRHYTREAGVRNLEREVGSVVRKVAVRFAKGDTKAVTINKKFLQDALGAPRYLHDEVKERAMVPGLSVGLAWTPVGGDVLFIESARYQGKGHLTVTGQLGDVMKESVTAALSYLRTHSDSLRLDSTDFEKYDVHVHVPEGATPKDGPSAGIAMVTALASLFTGRVVKERLAMTGEVTLTGQVLPVGGIKEKVLAAYRAGVTTLILPEENRKDYLEDVPEDIRKMLSVHFVRQALQVLKLALER